MSIFLPPGPITGVIGAMGSGKSWALLSVGLAMAEQLNCNVVCNFSLNGRALYEYCGRMGYTRLLGRLLHGGIECKSLISGKNNFGLAKFFRDPKTLYIVDEAGIYLNSRNFKEIPKEFLVELCQIRHGSRRILWASQYYDQVDKTLRQLTASFIHCEGVTRYNQQLENTELIAKNFRVFESRNYDIYLNKVDSSLTGAKRFVNTQKLSLKSITGTLTDDDRKVFDIYQSIDEKLGDSPKIVLYPVPSHRVKKVSAA